MRSIREVGSQHRDRLAFDEAGATTSKMLGSTCIIVDSGQDQLSLLQPPDLSVEPI